MIELEYEKELLEVLRRAEHKEGCKDKEDYILYGLNQLYLKESKSPDYFKFKKVELKLYCLSCYKQFQIIYSYGINEKIDNFEIVKVID